jgi:hypothetical protein
MGRLRQVDVLLLVAPSVLVAQRLVKEIERMLSLSEALRELVIADE